MIKFIPLDDRYSFYFVESGITQFEHPVSNYYLKLNDFSINVILSFKWVFWGFHFFDSISKELQKQEHDFASVLDAEIRTRWDFSKKIEREISINDVKIASWEALDSYLKSDSSLQLFDENTKIHIRLQLNLDEFLLLSNAYTPALILFS